METANKLIYKQTKNPGKVVIFSLKVEVFILMVIILRLEES